MSWDPDKLAEAVQRMDEKWAKGGSPQPYPLQTNAKPRDTPAIVVRTFASGANRDVDTSKLDFEGFLSPLVMQRFAEYMHKNRFLRDGSIREADNWQKGMPLSVYMKSMWRHFFTTWASHRRGDLDLHEEELCALLFNVQGMLHEVVKAKQKVAESQREGEGL